MDEVVVKTLKEEKNYACFQVNGRDSPSEPQVLFSSSNSRKSLYCLANKCLYLVALSSGR